MPDNGCRMHWKVPPLVLWVSCGTAAAQNANVEITSTGFSPSTVTVSVGGRVLFFTHDSSRHDVQPDPHPLHSGCAELSMVGLVTRHSMEETGTFTTPKACGYHDELNPNFSGTIFVLPASGEQPDADGDGLPDPWESFYRLRFSSAEGVDGADGDPDADGRSNLLEYQADTHPRSPASRTRYFAEGASSRFFETSIALVNPGTTAAAVLLRFMKTDGSAVTHRIEVLGLSRRDVHPVTLQGLAGAEYSTVIETDEAVVAERMMRWDHTWYGTHSERAIEGPSTSWYFAEGATHSAFNLFYLIQNPGETAAAIEVTYLLPRPAPVVVKNYVIPPHSRRNIWVNIEDERLAATEIAASIRSTNGVPTIIERAMYLDADRLAFGAGHVAAGAPALSTEWFFAEGATGDYFDEFLLIGNPGPATASVFVRYLLPGGVTVSRAHEVAARSRRTIWVDREDPLLEHAAVSAIVTSNVPIVVERSMWWPGPTAASWQESHASAGATNPGVKWAVPDVDLESYILIANTSPFEALLSVRVVREQGAASSERRFTVPASSRFTLTSRELPSGCCGRAGAIIESVGPNPARIVVETSTYSSRIIIFSCPPPRERNFCLIDTPWAAGRNAAGTKLQD